MRVTDALELAYMDDPDADRTRDGFAKEEGKGYGPCVGLIGPEVGSVLLAVMDGLPLPMPLEAAAPLGLLELR